MQSLLSILWFSCILSLLSPLAIAKKVYHHTRAHHHHSVRIVKKTHRVIIHKRRNFRHTKGFSKKHYIRYYKKISYYHKVTVPQVLVPSTINVQHLDRASVAMQPKFYSHSVIAVDVNSGRILISKNTNIKQPIASISKLMAAITLLDAHVDMDQYITVTSADNDFIKHTSSRLRDGTQLRRRDLLLLSLMSSENKATHALARTAYAGGIGEFLSKMNQKAASLGMVNTHFISPTGLTFQNQSTAEDLVKLVKGAIEYNLIRQDTTTKYADVALTPVKLHRYVNSDRLVRNSNIQIELSKTGFINEAGECLVLYMVVKSHPIILVLLDSQFNQGRFLDAQAAERYLARIL